MKTTMSTLKGLGVGLAAAASLVACAHTPSPQAVQATNPTVSYNYRTDQELLQANQRAATFCAQYQTAPRTRTVTNNADGTRTVTYDCVAGVPPTVASTTPVPVPAPGLRYTYRSDQELIEASRIAASHCGPHPMSSTIVANVDGSRTVTVHCPPRS
jgi:hypothetical protein